MKDWLIKKLGGYTAAEVDGVLNAFDKYTGDIEQAEKNIAVVIAMLEKDNEKRVH